MREEVSHFCLAKFVFKHKQGALALMGWIKFPIAII